MNRSKIRELAAKTAARARSIAETAPASPAEPASEAKAAVPAPTGVVPLKTHQRPALRVFDGDGGTKARKGLTVSRAALNTARARSRRRPENDPDLAAAALAAFRPYEPAPGVLPKGKKLAMDEVLPGTASWAGGAIVQAGFFADLTFPGYPLLAQWSNQTEYRKVSERLSTEMTRRWLELTSTSEDDKTELIKEINDWFKEMKVREHAQKLAFVDGTQGRAHLFIDTGDDDPKERAKPIGDGRNKLSLNKVTPKHPIKRLKVVEPTWVYPAKYNSSDPTDPAWLNPETWFVMGTETHRSRLLPFVGREVPDLLKPAFAFGGLSLTQMMKTYVDNWTSTRQHISRLIGNFSRSGIKTDLQQQLAPSDGSAAIEGGTAGDALMNRVDLYTELADNTGMMVLDNEDEEFFQFNTPLGTLDALQAQALEQVCLPAGMPVVVFLGLTPKGLNASSEGEIQAWEMWTNAYQEHFYGDFIRRMINFAQLSLRGSVDPEIGYKWLPLRTESPVDISTREKAEADRDAIYVDRAVLDPLEVRRKLKADPNSGYNSIDAEDVPEPPEQDDEGDGPEDTAGKVTGDKNQEGGDRAILPFGGDREWAESDHPRDEDGEFSSKGSGSSAGTKPDPAAKTKKGVIANLLTKGTTAKEVLAATGWPSVSMPAQAAAAGMHLEKYKEDGLTKYRGIPMTEEELWQRQVAKAEAKAKKQRGKPIARGPRGRDKSTYSLLEHLSDIGGIKPGPDVDAIFGGTNPFVPGFGRLIRKNGQSLDRAREAAVEAGYLEDSARLGKGTSTSTVRQLLDKMDAENRGSKQYRAGHEGSSESGIDPDEERSRMEDAFNSSMEELGLGSNDVDAATRNRVIEIMSKEGVSDPVAAYEQAIMEEDQRGIDSGENPGRTGIIPGWDADDARAAPQARRSPAESAPF